MKAFKKIVKILALIGMVAGTVKVIMKVLNLSKRMNDYNEKAVFAGKKVTYNEEPFEKDSVASLFSGMDLDFKESKMKNAISQLDILGRFSGISVKVPKHWHVEMDGTAVQSGISKRFKDNSEDEEAPVLQINYDLKYSGLDVANPKEPEMLEDADEEVDELEVEDIVEEEVIEEVVEEVEEVEDQPVQEMSEETKKVIEEFEQTFEKEEIEEIFSDNVEEEIEEPNDVEDEEDTL
ncbi:hypothetical protein EZV73_19490 [Acidaminobacter sp. JC074]|uniref:hypothetical protein n=1 Tax=Acidaminobacter sp. JC074 TaxID=2530199 RepID=UPI001F0F3E92|nr:hypothetical protein [Acidaminobacter sp. JC074]MCH4889776.1 hypothetical protein [Acidaminobacter sp. JC074]